MPPPGFLRRRRSVGSRPDDPSAGADPAARYTGETMVRKLQFTMAVAMLALASHAFGDSQDRTCTRETFPNAAERLDVGTLFRPPAEAIETSDGVKLPATSFEVVIARIGADGKPVMACVDTEDAARHVLHAPIEQVRVRQAQEK